MSVNLVLGQWRIQDFPDVGAPTPKGDVKSYYFVSVSTDGRSILEIGYDADTWCGLYRCKLMWAITRANVNANTDARCR